MSLPDPQNREHGIIPVLDRAERLVAGADAGDLSVVKGLLAQGTFPATTLGRVLLRVAKRGSGESFVGVAECLIAAGADVDFREEDDTPLAAAVTARNVDLVRLLIEAGADPTIGYVGDGSSSSAVERCLYGGVGLEAIVEEVKVARPRKLDGNTLIAAADLGAPALAR